MLTDNQAGESRWITLNRVRCSLVLAGLLTVYGTTLLGGAFALGTVFKLDASGVLTTLHAFSGGDGAVPGATLIQGSDGRFYGTTFRGGAFGRGTIFRLDSAGTLVTLHSFNGSDGADPFAGLTQATDGNLYGTTSQGGPHGRLNVGGVVFRLSVGGSQ